MTFRYRRLVAFLFVLSALICGLAVGTLIGGAYLVPKGSGLAGPFMALGYGVIGAVLAAAAALIPTFRMRGRTFLWVAAPTIVAGLVLAGLIGYRALQTRSEQQSYLAQQHASLPPFSLVYEVLVPQADAPFTRFDFDSSTREFLVERAEGAYCRGSVDPASEEKVTLLVALRHVEELLARTPSPCPGGGETLANLSFHISEHKPPDTRGEVAITGACLARHSELADLVESVEAVYRQLEARCR